MSEMSPAEAIFFAALEKPLAERAAYLDEACAGQPELRARVERLLAAHSRADGFLEAEATAEAPSSSSSRDLTVTQDAPSETAGVLIAGKYKLLQEVGEGGMGTVWMADQTAPVRRRVAVKLIRVDRGQTRTVLTRFEAERQAIALMDHPNIAKLLDAGTTEAGAPFFVMELVKGVPLTDYCDRQRLGIPERLALFMQICSAVQHAHQKGIIHRDLKPSNILVESHDGKPVPKVIDFGLAKATSGLQLTEQTLFTGFGTVLGTPLYMAPEQAAFNAVDIDTRADVYALGVILYELLTGTTPISRESIRQAQLDEMLRLIREQDAPTPSSRLSTTDGRPAIAANRNTEPDRLGRFVRGDLDWVVMKALAKERERRYETASGFARDVERFLAHEPVTAGPPTAGYRLRKFIRRNRGPVIAAGLVLLTLLGGVVGTTAGFYRAEQKRREAERAQVSERHARQEAETNLAYTRKGNEILGLVFAGLHPKKIAESGRPLQDLLRENLGLAVKELEGSAIGDPLTVAAMQSTLGVSLLGLGEAEQAVTLFIRARETRAARLGPEHPDTLSSTSNLAAGYRDSGKLDLALPLMEETLKLIRAKLGPDHPDTLSNTSNLALAYRDAGKLDRALPLFEETLKRRRAKLGPEHPDTLSSISNLAAGYRAAGKFDLAISLVEETLELQKARLGPDHPDTLVTMNELAGGFQDAGRLDRALPLFEETLKRRRERLGPDHPDTLLSMNNLALGYRVTGKLDRAIHLFEETLECQKAKSGLDHPEALRSMGNLAQAYRDASKLDQALPLFEETLKQMRTKLGHDHPDTFIVMNDLALGYRDVGRSDRALPLFEETLERQKAKLGPGHPNTLVTMGNLAGAYKDTGRLDQALSLLKQTLEVMRLSLGPEHPDRLTRMNELAVGYWSTKRLDESVPLFEELLTLQQKTLGRQNPKTQITVANLGVNYKDAGRLVEALPLLEEAYRSSKNMPVLRWVGGALLDGYLKAGKRAEASKLAGEILAEARQSQPSGSAQMAGILVQYSLALLQAGAFADAEPLLREALAIRKKTQPDAWTTFNTEAMLGWALLGQKKYDQAAPLLLQGYEGMKAREKSIPPERATRIPEALDRLIEFYTVTDKPEEAAKWKAERAKYPEAAPVPGDKK